MDRAVFFNALRGNRLLGPVLTMDEVHGCEAILDAAAECSGSIAAYLLATAYHETAHTMEPINEYGGEAYFFRRYDLQGNRPDIATRLGNTQPGDGARYHGRGYVQLTGRANYAKASTKVGFDLVANPELANRPDIAARVMRTGMLEGWFTGKRVGQYLTTTPATRQAFELARKVINGTDRAEDIAGYALQFQTALLAAGYAHG